MNLILSQIGHANLLDDEMLGKANGDNYIDISV